MIRLLSSEGELQLVYCEPDEAPPYAILSHTWSSEEVTYQELCKVLDGSEIPKSHKGWKKIEQ